LLRRALMNPIRVLVANRPRLRLSSASIRLPRLWSTRLFHRRITAEILSSPYRGRSCDQPCLRFRISARSRQQLACSVVRNTAGGACDRGDGFEITSSHSVKSNCRRGWYVGRYAHCEKLRICLSDQPHRLFARSDGCGFSPFARKYWSDLRFPYCWDRDRSRG